MKATLLAAFCLGAVGDIGGHLAYRYMHPESPAALTKTPPVPGPPATPAEDRGTLVKPIEAGPIAPESLSEDELATATHEVLFHYLQGCGVLVDEARAPMCLVSVASLRLWTASLPVGRVRASYDQWLDWFAAKSNEALRIPRSVASLPKPYR